MVLHVLDGLLARPAEMVQPCVDHQPRGAHELVAEVAEQVGALGAVRLGLLKKPNSRASSKHVHQFGSPELPEPSTLPVGDAMDYVSDNFGEMPMSSVRCSMEVLSVRLFCPRSVSGTG